MPGKPSLGRPLCRGTKKDGSACQRRAAAGSAYCGAHGGSTRRVGRATKLTKELADTIAEAIKTGATIEVAAQAAGVHRTTIHDWQRKGEDDTEAGKDTVYAYLSDNLTRARAEGEVALVRTIRQHGPLDWRAAAWLLERRHPERWARRDNVDVNLTERSKPRVVEPEESGRDRILAILGAAMKPPATQEDTHA